MRVSVVLGPGHHGPEVVQALRRGGVLGRVIHQHPRFVVEGGDGRELARAPSLDLAIRAMWAGWRRLPVVGQWETPRGPAAALQGRVARRFLGPHDLLIAWLQVGLESLRQARRANTSALLEHPMNHILHYDEELRRERGRWGQSLGLFGDFPAVLRRRMLAECEEAPYISVLSSYSRRSFEAYGVSPSRIVEIPLGVDHEHFTPREGERAPGPLRVVCVGRIEMMKGVQYLLEALRRLRGVPMEVSLVGPATSDARPLLERLGDPRVRCLPSVGRAALPEVYRSADVLVFPSVNDALGLVMLEAMSCGLPVIASDHTGAVDVLRDGVDGFVVPSGDAAAIAERLEPLAREPGAAAELGRSARQRILERYTLDHHAARLLDVCRRLTPRDAQP